MGFQVGGTWPGEVTVTEFDFIENGIWKVYSINSPIYKGIEDWENEGGALFLEYHQRS